VRTRWWTWARLLAGADVLEAVPERCDYQELNSAGKTGSRTRIPALRSNRAYWRILFVAGDGATARASFDAQSDRF
jgi:hypothetical protein